MSAPVQDRPGEKLTMGIDPWEKNWMRASIVLLVAFAAMITIAGFTAGFQLPGPEQEIDPKTVDADGSMFAAPGVDEVAPGKFKAYIMSQTFSFSPPEIIVPAGAEVELFVTSRDVQHGFKITDTNVNFQVVPGQVSKLKFTFDQPGQYPYLCTEYCGQGHANMFGTVKVVPQAEYDALKAEEQS